MGLAYLGLEEAAVLDTNFLIHLEESSSSLDAAFDWEELKLFDNVLHTMSIDQTNINSTAQVIFILQFKPKLCQFK